MVNVRRLETLVLLVLLAGYAGSTTSDGFGAGTTPETPASAALPLTSGRWPIKHVVILYQENHSFDNVLGQLCVRLDRCSGARSGRLPGGTRIALSPASDFVPDVHHSGIWQRIALNHGNMNGFARIGGCTASGGYACYTGFAPSQIPNLARLARHFVIADHTFESRSMPSFGSHLDLVAQGLDGFTGDNPIRTPGAKGRGPGWGCDSFRSATWQEAPGSRVQLVPSCVPEPNGSGPFSPSPVKWVPTLMDRMQAQGVSWKIYGTPPAQARSDPRGYGWSICPTFADCLNTSQVNDLVPASTVIADARRGRLPNVSLVIPSTANSQHNGTSMARGDNWIGHVVSSIERGPAWGSTAIFITYDDCGCFYDHLAPPGNLGIRVPMTIVSPWAKRSYTDSHVASFSSIIAFIEHDFGLRPLSGRDANAYDYADAFDFRRPRLRPVPMTRSRIPHRTRPRSTRSGGGWAT